MTNFLARFADDEAAATSIEYGLIAAAIAGVLIVATPPLATAIGNMLTALATALNNGQPS